VEKSEEVNVVKEYIVAIDPGTLKIGVAILEYGTRKYVISKQFYVESKDDDWLTRSFELVANAIEFIKTYLPGKLKAVAVEDQYVKENKSTTIKLARMSGIFLGMLRATYPDFEVILVQPRKVSKLTGINENNYQVLGKSYHHAIVQYVRKVLNIPLDEKHEDEAFAILIGMAA